MKKLIVKFFADKMDCFLILPTMGFASRQLAICWLRWAVGVEVWKLKNP